MPLINCEIALDPNWSGNCVIVATNEAGQATTFSITDAKLYFTKLAKYVLLKLGLSAGMSVADGTIQKKIYRSGSTALIISNKKKENI